MVLAANYQACYRTSLPLIITNTSWSCGNCSQSFSLATDPSESLAAVALADLKGETIAAPAVTVGAELGPALWA